MPTIFELFGFPVDDRSPEVEAVRQARQCPFMDATCDGGGNRYQTKIKLTPQEPLTQYFNKGVAEVIPGVCSIQSGEEIWVVCPRRLFAAKFDFQSIPSVNSALQQHEHDLLVQAGLPLETEIGIWAEVSLKHKVEDVEINYHFDYVLAPIVEISLNTFLNKSDFADLTDRDRDQLVKIAIKGDAGIEFHGSNTFTDILLPKLAPPKVELLKAILRRRLAAIFTL